MSPDRTRVLGAIIAGGRSRRFGSDKAVALLGGKCLLDHVHEAVTAQVDDVVVCGRAWPGLFAVPDFPLADAGPLGGLCGALHFARSRGYSHVLSAPVDVVPFPAGVRKRLVGEEPRVLAEQFLIGAWPVELADDLTAHLRAGQRSVKSWIDASDAQYTAWHGPMRNINHRADLSGPVAHAAERPCFDMPVPIVHPGIGRRARAHLDHAAGVRPEPSACSGSESP